ncbi:hypothetical protein DFH08DRAFT_1022222 [Mycena albidolilacea]|uniref:Uncharacterized protein n=1 Tax=Mycena albidolilacea TaxID=1033008 RepID=A0AAD7EK69_9AGAR|nr:hypothetical protein DFH08DRAFT_1022222 [Mycena albidolilacea]
MLAFSVLSLVVLVSLAVPTVSLTNTSIPHFHTIPLQPSTWQELATSHFYIPLILLASALGRFIDFGGAAGLSAVTMIATMVSFSQSASGTNPVGDQLECVLRNVYGNDFGNNSIKLATKYLRSVAEYSGTVFRACLSARNVAPFVQGVPENMTIPSTGTLHTEFLGWESTKSTSWVLIPGALIAIATIYAVHKSLTHHKENPEGEEFDPADTLDLVSASAAGGVSGVFIGTREDRRKAAEDINIVLGTVPGQRIALKRQYHIPLALTVRSGVCDMSDEHKNVLQFNGTKYFGHKPGTVLGVSRKLSWV